MTYKTKHKLFNMFHWALKTMFDTGDTASRNEVRNVLFEVWDYMHETNEISDVEQETSETK